MSKFWRDKNVFLTGHTGFKGSWLSLWLQVLGANVTGYALEPPTSPSMFTEAEIGSAMSSHLGDIRNSQLLIESLQTAKPEIVFHMAAQPLVRYSYANPIETYDVNVMGTVRLLDAIRTIPGIKAVVVVTTDKCYANKEWPWGYRENEPMGGHDPYSSSKGCVELVTASMRSSFFSANSFSKHGVAVASARAGNVIGGGDWAADRLIPDILKAFANNEPVLIRNPSAIRPWQHVLESLRGYLTLAERLYTGGTVYAEGWNFGPRDDDARPVELLVKKMADLWGPDARWIIDDGHKLHEANYLKLDISKAKTQLGWSPMLSLDEALKMTVEWARNRQKGMNVKQITLDQIASYQKIMETNQT